MGNSTDRVYASIIKKRKNSQVAELVDAKSGCYTITSLTIRYDSMWVAERTANGVIILGLNPVYPTTSL
jgi:hypothetical protein